MDKMNIFKIKTKDIYLLLIREKWCLPTAILRWENIFPEFEVCDWNIWEKLFSLVFKFCRETWLQMLQYKILHYIINCNEKLYHWRLKLEPTCTYCEEKDTIIHFFINCKESYRFWNDFFKWWNNIHIIKIENSGIHVNEHILFGFTNNGDYFDGLNYCLLQGKLYIYKMKHNYKNAICFWSGYLPMIKRKLLREIEMRKNYELKPLPELQYILSNL